ncbi:acid-sensing ion channel 5 [Elysia marginata]|uniref:Acid-sensing ion channel 5 n=1 Tax=Elysia marginata TaxID=1093978 RepID=A0AAV4HGW7_9GAST|nr:acid-sensing ion channel 5 [Elysia marginata]
MAETAKEKSFPAVVTGDFGHNNQDHSDGYQDQDETPRDVKEAIKLYQESASIHGVANILGPQVYSFRRPMWMLLVVAMATMMTWTLYSQISELRKYPIKTDIKMSLQNQLPFPAVTICSLNQYYKERVPDDEMAS